MRKKGLISLIIAFIFIISSAVVSYNFLRKVIYHPPNIDKYPIDNSPIEDPEPPVYDSDDLPNEVDITDVNSIAVLVNRIYRLPYDFVPSPLVRPNVVTKHHRMMVRDVMKQPLEDMFREAQSLGFNLTLASAYRSYDLQESIYNNMLKTYGEVYTNKYSAPPGHSEHQTGLAVDISSPIFDFQLKQEFGDTREGIWLKQNCTRFGFILRYPQGKEGITGYSYEPWHFRYVGTELAQKIGDQGLTMEEFFGVAQ